jgi:hypothetical protein
VNNGGFTQYYFNSTGDLAQFAPTALDTIGATETAKVVRRANALFGPSGPPSDRSLRQDQLEALVQTHEEFFEELDQAFYAYPDDISALLIAYLTKRK